MSRLARLIASATLIAACANSSAARGENPFPALPQAEIEAVTASGTHRFTVWIAADDRSRQRGLMFVRELPGDRGMLFLFEHPQEAAFWMKDTYLSLDLVFIEPAGTVVNIASDARPFSLEPIPSNGPVIAVLEVPAGTARRIGLAPGDRVRLPSLRTTGIRLLPEARSESPAGPSVEWPILARAQIRAIVGATHQTSGQKPWMVAASRRAPVLRTCNDHGRSPCRSTCLSPEI